MTDGLRILEQRIGRLEAAVGDIRDRLANIIQVSTRPEDGLALARGIAESLTKRVLSDIELKPASTLDACLRELETPEVMSRRLVPLEIISLLHTIRIMGNKAAHGALQIRPAQNDVGLILQALLRVVEWYFAEFDRGPHVHPLFRTPESGRADLNRDLLERLLVLVQGWHDEVVETVAKLQSTADPREAHRIEFVYVNTRKYLPQIMSIRELLGTNPESAELRKGLDGFLELLTESHYRGEITSVACRGAEYLCSPLGGTGPWSTAFLGKPAPPQEHEAVNLSRLQMQLQVVTDAVMRLLSG